MSLKVSREAVEEAYSSLASAPPGRKAIARAAIEAALPIEKEQWEREVRERATENRLAVIDKAADHGEVSFNSAEKVIAGFLEAIFGPEEEGESTQVDDPEQGSTERGGELTAPEPSQERCGDCGGPLPCDCTACDGWMP